MRMSRGEKAFTVFNNIFMVVLGLVSFYPFIYMLAVSFNDGMDTMKNGVWLLPNKFTFVNYQVVLNNPVIKSAFMVTIGRTVIGTITSLIVTALAAYALSFKELPFKKLIGLYILIPMLFGGGIVPYYLQLKNLHLINSFWVYIIPGLFSIWNMFVMRSFFIGIPESLRESAEIDGANQLTVLIKIIFPLSLPMFAALGLFTAVGHWNDWFAGAFFVNKINLIPLQTYLQRLLNASDLSAVTSTGATASKALSESAARGGDITRITLMSVKMATVMIGTLPILCVYPFLQKYFVKGVLIGSVKG